MVKHGAIEIRGINPPRSSFTDPSRNPPNPAGLPSGFTSLGQKPGEFTMADLLKFAGVA